MTHFKITFALSAFLAPIVGQAESATPNILIIQCDQFSQRVIEAYGETVGLTPILDSLANTGVVFDNAYIGAPMSQPSRAALWTGMMPHQTDVRSNSIEPINMPVDKSISSLGELFSAKGYDAVHFGKKHDMGALRGFKHTVPISERFSDPNFPVNQDSFMDVATTKDVVSYLLNRDKEDKPFICIADLQNPHNICGFIGAFAGPDALPGKNVKLPELPANFEVQGWESLPLPIQYLCCSHRRLTEAAHWSPAQYQHYIAAYRYYSQMVCKQIEQILATLHSTKDGDNTIIIFTADHGDGMASHRMVSKQTSFYEEIVNVPFIISGAGIKKRDKNVEPLAHVTLDLLPTLCGLAGIEIPKDKRGINWAPMLTEGKRESGHDYVVSEWHSEYEYVVSPGRMVRSMDFKYMHYLEGNGEELYDLRSDNGETTNLAKDEKYSKILNQHREMLAEYVKETGDDYFSLEVQVDPRCRAHKLGYQNHVGAYAKVYAEEKLWDLVFEDNGIDTNWEDNWFLDGEIAKVKNTPNGLEFKSGVGNGGTSKKGAEWDEYNSNHGVLWSKKSFEDGIRVVYDFMRLDEYSEVGIVLFYILAEGKGGEGTEADIYQWRDSRKVPYMKTYFNNIKLGHISYATDLNEEKAYIRSRVYPVIPGEIEFKELEIPPGFDNRNLFKQNVWYRISVTKVGNELKFEVTKDGKTEIFFWHHERIKDLTQGRIGFRQMTGRNSLYKNIKVYQKADLK